MIAILDRLTSLEIKEERTLREHTHRDVGPRVLTARDILVQEIPLSRNIKVKDLVVFLSAIPGMSIHISHGHRPCIQTYLQPSYSRSASPAGVLGRIFWYCDMTYVNQVAQGVWSDHSERLGRESGAPALIFAYLSIFDRRQRQSSRGNGIMSMFWLCSFR